MDIVTNCFLNWNPSSHILGQLLDPFREGILCIGYWLTQELTMGHNVKKMSLWSAQLQMVHLSQFGIDRHKQHCNLH